PSPEAVTLLIDKARFQKFAEASGLPVPRTAVVAEVGDIAALKRLRFPVIVKPADKRAVYLNQTERLHTAQNLPESEPPCHRLLATAGEIVVQEWIDGPDRDILFTLFHQGSKPDALTMFSGRKIVCHPPKVGSTAFCTAAP